MELKYIPNKGRSTRLSTCDEQDSQNMDMLKILKFARTQSWTSSSNFEDVQVFKRKSEIFT